MIKFIENCNVYLSMLDAVLSLLIANCELVYEAWIES